MDLVDIRCFLMVVQEGGVCRAAEKLNRFQSNVTMRIQKLERDVGSALFIREGRSVRLSQKGKVFLDYAQQLLALEEKGRWAVSDDLTPRGRLRIGAMESTAASRLPQVLAHFHRHYQEVDIELVTGPTRKMLAGVLANDIDVAFVADVIPLRGIQSSAVFDEALCVISPKPGALVASPEAAADQSLVTFATGCAYRELFEDWLREAGFKPRRVFELGSYHGIISCVAAGTGVSVVPRSTLELLPSSDLIHIAPFPFRPQIKTLMIWREGEKNPAITSLLKEIELGAQ
jgi:DNA-binding transcriptional LysR family regulator